ncbi:hypothetical protein ACFSSA_03635 [Luteolibacter algae]|uniref:DUF4165 domain-containing protein n=1 Tax=Luteolibacter algae TaxID=454151 RepID=A0ABW5D3W6_9BACT
MKSRISLLFLLGLCSVSANGFIRQIQTINGQSVVYDIPVANDSGSVQSRPLSAESAVFQLYTTVVEANKTETLKKLDEKAVGTYLPAASLQILSEDPYYPARTRADKPYGVRLTVSGLLQDTPDVPDYAKTVYASRSYATSDPVTYQLNGVKGTYADVFTFRQNGTFVENNVLQRLPGDSPSLAVGEESFTVYLNSGTGPASELAKATVQIWPVAIAQVAGIEEGERYTATPTDGRFSVRNIYPDSVTYAQVYKGPHVIGTVGTPLPSTVVAYKTHAPQTAVLTLTDLPGLVKDDGVYTVEILTITPFNNRAPELLAHVTFEVKRTLRVNSMVTTLE